MRIGILGGGQLGQMLMLAAHPLGIEVGSYEAKAGSPASRVGATTVGEIGDTDRLHDWVSKCDVITYEFENFPAALVADVSEVRRVLPDTLALASAQDRLFEKKLFTDLKIPISPFRAIDNEKDIDNAIRELPLPIIFKTRTGGYDGKGQFTFRRGDFKDKILEMLEHGPLVAEQKQPLTTEISVVGVRGLDGHIVTYAVTENEHREGILHKSTVPADVSDEMAQDARDYMTAILKKLDYVGVLTLELFVVGDTLMANEMAPRVHNSGHWTIEGAETSQFENHIRAVAGLPLGNTNLVAPCAMINLVGAIPSPRSLLRMGGVHLHIYGKEPRPGRKVGHVTVTAPDFETLTERVVAVENVVNNVLH